MEDYALMDLLNRRRAELGDELIHVEPCAYYSIESRDAERDQYRAGYKAAYIGLLDDLVGLLSADSEGGVDDPLRPLIY